MRIVTLVATATLAMGTGAAMAGPASGTVKSTTGTISPKQAIGYLVRDSRNARNTRIELLLSEVPVDGTKLADELDPHVVAINFDALRDRNYLLLWVGADNTVSMNATYSATMTQYLNDTAGGLKAEFPTNTPTRIEGRVYSPSPLKTMDGPTYTVDVKFSADITRPPAGTPLPVGGGDAGKALTTWLAAVARKNWPAVKAGLSQRALPMFDHDYNTPAENASSAADLLNAWLPLAKLKVGAGQLRGDTVAVLEIEGERFGSPWMSLVRMVKSGAAWQFDQSAPAGSLR